MGSNTTSINVLQAFHGDSLLIKTYDENGNEFIILIDGGTAQTFKYSLKSALSKITCINLLILTHIDSDHTAGLLKFFNSTLISRINIDEIWINHPELIEVTTGSLISVKQADDLKKLIIEKKPPTIMRQISVENGTIKIRGIEFIVLSPTNEIVEKLYKKWEIIRAQNSNTTKNVGISEFQNLDGIVSQPSLKDLANIPFEPASRIFDDLFNASSISFILKCSDLSILLLADSRPEIIYESLLNLNYTIENPLVVDYVKVSHHGSLNNTSQELLGLVKSNNYIISTNGGSADHKHPSRETLARIIYNTNRTDERLNIYLNYKLEDVEKKTGPLYNESDLEAGNFRIGYRNIF